MAGGMGDAFPAGYESDSSLDEQLDMGYVSNNQRFSYIQGLDACDTDDYVSLFKRAINQGDTVKIEQLLDNDVDVDSRLDFEWSPLMCAVTKANYNVAKLLLDRGASANFSKDNWTVLMASCTASASKDKIAACVGLLLSRQADPNMTDSSQMTCLMLAARDGHTKVLTLLVSHGAEIDKQDSNGFTALCFAVQHGREEAVLSLLQMGADKTIQTKNGETPADLAQHFRQPQIAKVLAASSAVSETFRKQTLSKFFTNNTSIEGVDRMNDIELFLHGLDLGYLSEFLTNKDILWNELLTMDKKDLEKTGITDPVDQQKLLNAQRQIQLDRVDLDMLDKLEVKASGEELQSFLISVNHQCCYLTETLQDVIKGFPRHPSQVVFSIDSKKDAQSTCNQLVVQIKNLQKEVICLRHLLCQVTDSRDCSLIPGSGCRSSWRSCFLSPITLSTVGAAFLVLLFKAAGSSFSLQ